MKNKIFWIFISLLGGVLLYFSFFESDIETSSEIENNTGDSLTYISEVNNTQVLKVFNFNQEKFIKSLKIKQEKDPYSTSYFNSKEKKTIIITQQSDPYGYQVYLQDQSKVKSLGLLKERVEEVIFNKNYMYALVYSNDNSIHLKKFKLTQLDKPLKTWELEGDPERLLLDENTNNMYIITRTNKIFLYSLKNDDQLQKNEILEHGYDLNAFIEENNLWVLPREMLDNVNVKSEKNKEVKSLIIVDLLNGRIKKEIPTKYQPKFIQVDKERVYVITGTPNESFLEIYSRKTYEIEKIIEVNASAIYGFVDANNGKYIFTDRGIFKVQQTHLNKVTTESISSNIDLIIR
ncbi:hypothetical protein ACQKFK_29575 [Bacillus mycoides]|uniref:hypothetical protein n=1 Tax=Bacillus mycoides TaxID=1405 RepID=UPI003CFC2173